MKVVLSGGGTAGHINPALALAEILQERGHEVFFAGTPQGVEARLVKQADIPFKGFEATGFDRSKPATLIKALQKMSKSSKQAAVWFDDVKPDVVVAFGGYVCLPVARAAKKRGIPLVVHEQNSVMGLANSYLAKQAKTVALTYAVAGSGRENEVVTGNPVRSSILASTRAEGRAFLDIPEDKLVLLVFGGSLGARHLNNALVSLKDQLLAYEDLVIVHITGTKDYEAVRESLALTTQEEAQWQLFAYQDNMGECLAASDIALTRAGATSLAEIAARCIPALLVPFPYATKDHQTTNAQSYVKAGAAYLVADDDLGSPEFSHALFRLIENKQVRQEMVQAAAAFKAEDAAARLADVVIGAVKA